MHAMASGRQSKGPRHPSRTTGAQIVAAQMADQSRTNTLTRIGIAVLLAAVVALVCVVRIRLAGLPLERDEGEYAYAGQLILKGIPPYAAIYNMKFPGLYYAYAAMMAVFGQTATGVRIGLLLVHVVSLALLYVWARRVAGELVAGIGTAVFALLALDRWSMGVFAHATHFVVLFVLAGLVVLQDGRRPWRLALSGLMFGLAIVMKQQAIPFAVLGIALAMRGGESLWSRDAIRRGVIVAAGVVVSLLGLVAVMAVQGVFGQFWHWTFEYAAAYVSTTPLSMAPAIFSMAWGYVTLATGWWWYLGLMGVVFLVVTGWSSDSRGALIGLLAAAALAIVPGYFFRPHYFILAMPAIALLAGVTFASADRMFARSMKAGTARVLTLTLVAAVAAIQVGRDWRFLFQMSPTEVIRAVYETNPFLEAPEIGRYLRAHTGPDDRIAVLGSEPEVLFYADRPSATGYIYMYPLTERQPFADEMRQELMQDLQRVKPRYLVFVDSGTSWVANLQPDTRLITWANNFASACYERVGIVDLDPAGASTIHWDAAQVGYQPRFQTKVSILRRTEAAGCAAP